MVEVLNMLSSLINVLPSLIGAGLTAISDRRIKIPSESQFDDCNAVQYVAKRNWLILQARKDAKKRPSTLLVNSVSLICPLVAFGLIFSFLYELFPSIQDTDSWNLALPACIVLCLFCLSYILFFIVLPIILALLFILFLLLLLSNTPTLDDFIKKLQGHKDFKKSLKEGYYLHISQVLEIASNFDAYLLFDADSPDANPYSPKEITSFKNRVIGAKTINPATSIYDMIKGAPSEKMVVFIYSQHGRTSHERAEEAQAKCNEDKECENVRVYDLGPVCGDMRELEIVAHQLHYLQNGKCLRLP